MGPDAEQRLAGATLVNAMWWYAGTVLNPARALRQAGLAGSPTVQGETPLEPPRPGLGPHFSGLAPAAEDLDRPSGHEPLVAEFDRMAEVYELYVAPFSRPIFEEALAALRPWLVEDARVLDAGCGPGRELRQVARLVPRGEVVGVDLAAGMVAAAARACHAHGLDNTAFVRADVGDLPDTFTDAFDLVYSVLAHHHFPEPAAAAAGAFRCLRPGGLYAVIDPGPAWYNRLAAPLARWADPGWIGFTTPGKFDGLLREAGFSRVSWQSLLPGFGLALGQKP
jgi:SAM-dependent methyltransferase